MFVCGVGVCVCGGLIKASVAHRVPSLSVQTVWYRAPEVLLKNYDFGPPIDMWSVGILLAEIAGETWFKRETAAQCLKAHLDRFQSPPDSVTAQWPKWNKASARKSDKGWPAELRRLLGQAGEHFVTSLLRLDPAARPQASVALEDAFLHPTRLAGADIVHSGHRHPWCILRGCMSRETLEWLRGDFDDLNFLSLDFEAKRANVKTEAGRKFIMSGKTVADPGSSTMCTLSLSALLPLPRLRSWLEAFKRVNAGALAALQERARVATRALSAVDAKTNAQAFLTTPLDSWFCAAAELCVVQAEGHWEEPRHNDGGAAVALMGITLWGHRRLDCETAENDTISLGNFPGRVYVGPLTGPTHSVTHTPSPDDELLQGRYSVSIILRTSLFGHARSRTKDVTPSPITFFQVSQGPKQENWEVCQGVTRHATTKGFGFRHHRVLQSIDLAPSRVRRCRRRQR